MTWQMRNTAQVRVTTLPAQRGPQVARCGGCSSSPAQRAQATPSFFCRLDDEVVYWNTSRLSG